MDDHCSYCYASDFKETMKQVIKVARLDLQGKMVINEYSKDGLNLLD